MWVINLRFLQASAATNFKVMGQPNLEKPLEICFCGIAC